MVCVAQGDTLLICRGRGQCVCMLYTPLGIGLWVCSNYHVQLGVVSLHRDYAVNSNMNSRTSEAPSTSTCVYKMCYCILIPINRPSLCEESGLLTQGTIYG